MSIEFYHDTETDNRLLRRVTKWIVDLAVVFTLALFLVQLFCHILTYLVSYWYIILFHYYSLDTSLFPNEIQKGGRSR